MPRVSNDARPDRDDLVVTLYLTGRSFRAIGADPRVQLSDRGARLAVQRGLAVAPPPKHLLDQLMTDAYAGSVRGEPRAQEQMRRLRRLVDGGGVHGARTPARSACPGCGCTRQHRRRSA